MECFDRFYIAINGQSHKGEEHTERERERENDEKSVIFQHIVVLVVL